VKRLADALGLVLVTCLGIRLAAWLIEPVLPLLGGLAVASGLAYWLLIGRGSGSGRYR
jgi:hypothetical protein